MRTDGPDFIGIGMPKAGTGWLYDQLSAHPDFWMPPVKELVYLSQKRPKLQFVDEAGRARAPRDEKDGTKRKKRRDRSQRDRLIQKTALTSRDEAFLEYAACCQGKARDLESYAGFFGFKGTKLSGDITPPYCNLTEEVIRQVGERFPSTKIVLLLRDPVARAWSRICMSHEAGHFDTELLQDAHAFRSYVEDMPKLRVRATDTFGRWRSAAPHLPFRYFFFEDLVERPEELRDEILQFLGADPGKKGRQVPADYNRKAGPRLDVPPVAKGVLVECFRQELKDCAEMFGGRASAWPAAYGA